MISFMNRDTEQPNENQSSFGPSNQSSSYEGDKQPENGWASKGYAGIQDPNQSSAQIQPLPWQQNDMQAQPQQQMSAPSWQTQDVGHEGTTQGGMNRDQYRDAWMSSGIGNNQAMDQWLLQHGGQRLNDSGVVRTPFGEILDNGIGYKTGNGRPGWTDIGMNNMPQGQFGSFGPSSNQPNQFQGSMFGNPQQSQMQPQMQQQVDPRMMQFLIQSMLGTQQMQSGPQSTLMQTHFQKPDLFANAGQNMDISSFLGGPSGMMNDYQPGGDIPRTIDRTGFGGRMY